MPSYPDNFNPDLLERIPLSANMVLDVGCATGALGAAYRRLNPRAVLLGIDRNPEAAAVATERLDAVAVVDVEADPVPFELEQPLDCIIYGDVIEHLADPWAVIRRHMEVLSDEGTILICVPNLEHWSFASNLLRGTWEYQPDGLFDATHLRWFSLESMRKGLLELGLVPCDVHSRIFNIKEAEAFTNAIAPALAALDVDPKTYFNRCSPLQYVWRARKKIPERIMIVGNMLEPVGGVSHVRVVYPLEAMRTDPAVSTHLLTTPVVPNPPGDSPRILVLHRPGMTGEAGAAMLRRLMGDGWLIVTEFDDHPDHFGMLSDEQLAFRGVHAVQTSTPALAAVLRNINPEVMTFPNTIRTLPEVRNFVDPNAMTVFFGALNRERDWAPLIPVLNEVAETVGDRLRFCVVHDKGFFDALQTPHKQFTPTCDYDTYMALLGQCEISLMPLSDTPFNRAKSDLKFIEAAACRVASLSSHIVYAASIEDGRTGLLFHDSEELRDRLLRLVMMPGLARDLGDAARQYIIDERMLAYQVEQRIAWYRSLWERRAELTNALYSRLMRLPPLTAPPIMPRAELGAEL